MARDSNPITASIHKQENDRFSKMFIFTALINDRLACVCVCVFPAGILPKDGITNEGSTVSTVLPADGCSEYLLHHIASVVETVLKVM